MYTVILANQLNVIKQVFSLIFGVLKSAETPDVFYFLFITFTQRSMYRHFLFQLLFETLR